MLGKFNADFAAWISFFITCDTNVAGDPAKDYIIVLKM